MLQLAGLGPPVAAYSCLHVADANCVSKPLYTQAGTGGRSKKERRPRSPATTSTGASRAQRASPSPLAEGRSDLCGWGPGASCGRIALWGYSAVSSSRLLAGGDGGVKTVPPGAHLELVLDVVAVAVCSTPRASDGDPPRVRRRHPTNST